ncbi:NFATC2-interacting protein [Rhinophrynus dorsalis]
MENMVGEPHVVSSDESSDSDVELVRPRHVKRRRILPGTIPATVSVYSNKVNSCLKMLPDDPDALAFMEQELQRRMQGSEDLGSECVSKPVHLKPTKVQQRPPSQEESSPLYTLTDSEEEEEAKSKTQMERLRDASPSPPPTPKTPVNRKGGVYAKIREVDKQLKDLGTVLSPSHKSVTENDVIVVCSSPAPDLTIKVRRRGEIFRINIRMGDPLQKLAESMATRLSVNPSQILLLRGEEELNMSQTPQSLSLTVADIIECVVLSTSDEPGDEDQSDQICLKIQGKEKESHLSVTVGKTEPLQSLMDQYRDAMGLTKKRKVSFIFEGKKLKGKSTAEELGLESDDVIEVWL